MNLHIFIAIGLSIAFVIIREIPVVVFYLGIATYLVYVYIRIENKTRIQANGMGVVITGCDTGFGHALASRLENCGFTVFAGCLSVDGEGAQALKSQASEQLHVVALDVTSDDSVNSCLEYVENNCPETGLWAIVNNAGVNIMSDAELATLEMYKWVAEVNIYGMIRVTKAFLPLLRKSKGRVINVTSVKGRIPLPLDGTYSITKYAGEAWSDILRREMKRFGVKVVIIEPGDFGGRTGMLNDVTRKKLARELDTAWESAKDSVKQSYGRAYIDSLIKSIDSAGATAHHTIEPVIEAMTVAVTSVDPEYRYLVDGSNRMLDKFCVFARLNSILPCRVVDFFVPILWPLPPVAGQQ